MLCLFFSINATAQFEEALHTILEILRYPEDRPIRNRNVWNLAEFSNELQRGSILGQISDFRLEKMFPFRFQHFYLDHSGIMQKQTIQVSNSSFADGLLRLMYSIRCVMVSFVLIAFYVVHYFLESREVCLRAV